MYLFFRTPPSFGPFFLRMALVAIFLYQGGQKAFGWFGGEGWLATVNAWTSAEGVNMPTILISAAIVAELAVVVMLFFGLLTRLGGLLVVILMGAAIFYVHGGTTFENVQLPLTILASGLALLFMGGGHLSIDRAIGSNLLPTIG